MVLEPPGFPDLPHTAHVWGTGPELVPVQGDHPGPVAGVRTVAAAGAQLVEVDKLAVDIEHCTVLVPQIDPSVPQPVVQSWRRPLLVESAY